MPNLFYQMKRRFGFSNQPGCPQYSRVPRSLLWPVFIGLALLLGACNAPRQANGTPTPENLVETLVAAKLTEVSTQQVATQPATPVPASRPSATTTQLASATPTPSATATPLAVNVTGKVCYPGQTIPEMTAYFENTETHQVIELSVKENQDKYEVNLPPGTYQAYAWLSDFSRGGLYSRAVPCGLKAACTDHSALPFTVTNDEKLEGIDMCDWYAGPFNVPYPPGKKPEEVTGSLSGVLTYPGGRTPTLRVVAFNVDTHNWYYVETNPGWSAYTIPQLPPGTYQVVAYDEQGEAGGYADSSHNLIDVTVKAGEETNGVDITDWNAPSGSFPPDPTR